MGPLEGALQGPALSFLGQRVPRRGQVLAGPRPLLEFPVSWKEGGCAAFCFSRGEGKSARGAVRISGGSESWMLSLPVSRDQPSWPVVLSHSAVSDASALLEVSASPLQKSLCQARPDIAHDCACSRSPPHPLSPALRPPGCGPVLCRVLAAFQPPAGAPTQGGSHSLARRTRLMVTSTFPNGIAPTLSPESGPACTAG